MKVYWSVFLWAMLFSSIRFTPFVISSSDGLSNRVSVDARRASFFRVLLCFALMFFFVGFRSNVGDSRIYISNYRAIPEQFEMPEYSSRFLFDLLMRICKSYISTDPVVWLFMLESIPAILLSLTISRFSIDIKKTLFLFFAGGTFEYFFNGARQLVAVSICFYALKFIDENKFFKYLFSVLIASLFHGSAIIMIIVWFISKLRPWSLPMLVATLITIIACALSGSVFRRFVEVIIENTEYNVYIGSLNRNGVHPLRTLIAYIPVVLCLIYRDRVNEIDDKILNTLINLALISALLYTLAMFMTALLVARIAFYFGIFGLLLYPYILNVIIPERQRNAIIPLFYICFLLRFIFQMYYLYGGLEYISTPLGIIA